MAFLEVWREAAAWLADPDRAWFAVEAVAGFVAGFAFAGPWTDDDGEGD